MKKINMKVTAIIATAALAIALMALPALADTTQEQGSGWYGQMQGYMQKTFKPEQHQGLMNSTKMQNLHNSEGMQKAMQTGDGEQMQELMNLDPAVKAQMGQENLDKMNGFMSNSGGGMMSNDQGMAGPIGTTMSSSRSVMSL